jgi:hypothetical protein
MFGTDPTFTGDSGAVNSEMGKVFKQVSDV